MQYGPCILELINTSSQHLTADQIYLQLKQEYPSLVLATVYNNLNRLYQQGKIRKISLEGHPDRYDKTQRHDHLVCSKCGALSDLYLEDITAQLEAQVGFSIDGYDLKLQYLCPACRKQMKSSDTTS
jgi:Fe2+ or Zn2+ uptake regulation protein